MRATACEFLSGGEVVPNPTWAMPSHSHQVHELIVVLSGRMLLETAEQTVQAGPGDLLFYRAGHAHKETSDPQEPVNTLFISFKATQKVVADFALHMRDADTRVRQMVTWLVRDFRAGVPTAQLHALLRALLTEIRRLQASPPDPWLEDLRRHMQQNLARPVYLDDLARRVRMSKFALVRKFKRLSGRTPMHELQLLRLNQARAMMLASGLPVKAIAPAVGLNDEYQLSKLFRRHFGLSPRELRARRTTFETRAPGQI
ncbi:MAG: AraC family transcriptional regulator [Opitutaceae bacterium]|nr:AraC family transcriptional regulator [Opitutaceae bacterium]